MKIAVWYNFPAGGSKRALHDHLAGLKALGHTLEIWRPPVKQTSYLDLSEFGREHEVPLDDFLMDSTFYPRKIYLAMRRGGRTIRAMERHARTCAEQIDAGGFDVLFANTDMWVAAPFIGRYVHIPRILYLGEPNRRLFEAQPGHPWMLPRFAPGTRFVKRLRGLAHAGFEFRNARLLASAEVESAQAFDRLLVNSRFSRESVLRSYGCDATVCYLGIDAARFTNRRETRERYVISVGTLTASKRPDFIIRAVGEIPASERPKLMWIYNAAGPVEYPGELQRLAASLGVHFEPRSLVPDEELIGLLNRAAAFVYAPRLEPFGLAPLEANACGAPVVAVAEAGVRETVEDGVNGLLVEATPAAMAAGIRRLLGDPELAKRLGDKGEAYVHTRWSTNAAAKRLEHFLTSSAKGRGPA